MSLFYGFLLFGFHVTVLQVWCICSTMLSSFVIIFFPATVHHLRKVENLALIQCVNRPNFSCEALERASEADLIEDCRIRSNICIYIVNKSIVQIMITKLL